MKAELKLLGLAIAIVLAIVTNVVIVVADPIEKSYWLAFCCLCFMGLLMIALEIHLKENKCKTIAPDNGDSDE